MVLGFLNINKPMGWTSHDCVAKVRRLFQLKQVGHGGTLDPAATGVLPIALGKATRLLDYLPSDKGYQATIRFGVQTTSDDLEGEVIERSPCPELTLAQIESQLPSFLGNIQQIPPMYSAIQQDGKRLYSLARQGIAVDVPSRSIRVDQIDILDWRTGEFPELKVVIACGPGTYIRAIARDLGQALGVGGTLAGLIRTKSCGMTLEQSVTLEQLADDIDAGQPPLIPADKAIAHLPKLHLPTASAKRWCQGQLIELTANELEQISANGMTATATTIAIFHDQSHFLGMGQVLQREKAKCQLKPKKVFVPNLSEIVGTAEESFPEALSRDSEKC